MKSKPTGMAALGLLLFLVFFILRLQLIRDHGFAHPYWDQWYSEGATVVKPWVEGTFHFSDLMAQNSEHRIVLTRLVQIGLIEIFGQWDSLGQLVANAGIFSALAAGLVILILQSGPRWQSGPMAATFLCLFLLPIGWANTLWGFQSQFYFLIFFSLYAIIAVSRAAAFSSLWWTGLLLAVCSYLGMAGGAITPFACALIELLRPATWRSRILGTATWLILGSALIAYTPTVPGNSVKAQSVSELLVTLLKHLAFPGTHPGLGIVPLAVIFAGGCLALSPRFRGKWNQLDWFLWGTILWIAGQAAAIAYARGAGTPAPVHRYHDLLGMIVPTVFFFWWAIPRLIEAKVLTKQLIRLGALAWLVVASAGMYSAVTGALNHWLPARNEEFYLQERNLRKIIASNQFDAFGQLKPSETGSYLNPSAMRDLLTAPRLREVLAPTIRPPVVSDNVPNDYGSTEPMELHSALENLQSPRGRALAVTGFMADHAPTAAMHLNFLKSGAILTRGPKVRQGVQLYLVMTLPWHATEETIQGLESLQARDFSYPREISRAGVISRVLVTWPVAIGGVAFVLLSLVFLCLLPTRRLMRGPAV